MGHGHDHGVSATTDRRRLGIALTLLLGFAVAEVVTGLLAGSGAPLGAAGATTAPARRPGSVARLAAAAHRPAAAAALALAWGAFALAARPPAGALTYGLKRA